MTLPTIQPVDGPDWSSNPAFTTQGFGVDPVVAQFQVLFEQQIGYYAYAVLILEGDGDGSDWAVTIQTMTAPSTEGGAVIFEQTTVREFGVPVIVPMSCVGQSIRLIDGGASTYPHSMGGTLTLYSAFPFQTGFPGGTYAVNSEQTVPTMASLDFLPNGCAPGPHTVMVATQAAAWQLYLSLWPDTSGSVNVLLADETTMPAGGVEFIAPASAWHLEFQNNDGSDQNVQIFAMRDP